MPYTFPIGWYNTCCYLVPIRAALVPFVAGALRQLESREAWQTETDYEAAYNALAEFEACMTRLCVDDLIESQRQIYRLLDVALFGRGYVADVGPDGETIITPEIPATPNTGAQLPGLIERAAKLERLMDNAINGTFYQDYESNTSMRVEIVRIREILEQQGTGALDDDMLGQLQIIAGLLA